MNLKGNVLRERSQTKRSWLQYSILSHDHLKKRQNYTDGTQIGGCQGLGTGGRDRLLRHSTRKIFEVMELFSVLIMRMGTLLPNDNLKYKSKEKNKDIQNSKTTKIKNSKQKQNQVARESYPLLSVL